jgi:iron(III) transport system substrate-binding protein
MDTMNRSINLFLTTLVSVAVMAVTSTFAKEVVVYTSVDQVFSEPVLQMFEKETGIKVRPIPFT